MWANDQVGLYFPQVKQWFTVHWPLHWPLAATVVGAFLLEVNDLIVPGLRNRAGSAAQRFLQLPGEWEVSSGLLQQVDTKWLLHPERHRGTSLVVNQERSALPGAWGTSSSGCAGWVCWVADDFHKPASCWLLRADGAPCGCFLKNSERSFFLLLFSLSRHRMETCWNLRKGSENGKWFPTQF